MLLYFIVFYYSDMASALQQPAPTIVQTSHPEVAVDDSQCSINAMTQELHAILESTDKEGELGGCIEDMTLGDFLQIPNSYVTQNMGDELLVQMYCMVQKHTFLHKFLLYLFENPFTKECLKKQSDAGGCEYRDLKELPITKRADGAVMIMCVPLPMVAGAAQFLRTHFLVGFSKTKNDAVDAIGQLNLGDKLSFGNFDEERFEQYLKFMQMPEVLRQELFALFKENPKIVNGVFTVIAQLTIGGQISMYESKVHSDNKRKFGKITPQSQDEKKEKTVSAESILHDLMSKMLNDIQDELPTSDEAREIIVPAIDMVRQAGKDKKDFLSELDASGKYKGVLHSTLEFRIGYLQALVSEACYVSLSVCGIEGGADSVPLSLLETLIAINATSKEMKNK